MKNLKEIIFVLFCFVFILACQNSTENSGGSDTADIEMEDNNDKDSQLMLEDTISRDTFNAWKSRWATNHTLYMDSTTIDYFDVPLIDLEEVLHEEAITSYFYMGLEKISNGNFAPHLMIVGVKQSGPDYSLILDYTSTCPPYCN